MCGRGRETWTQRNDIKKERQGKRNRGKRHSDKERWKRMEKEKKLQRFCARETRRDMKTKKR